MPGITTTNLGEYLEGLGQTWIDRRKKKLEPMWNKSLKMIKGEDASDKVFKKGEAGTEAGDEWRCDSVINIVRVKVYTVFAMIIDIFLNTGELPVDLDIDDIIDVPPEQKAYFDMAKDEMLKLIKRQLKQRKADRQFMKKVLSLLYYGVAWSKYNVKPVEFKGFNRISQDSMPNMQYMVDQDQAVGMMMQQAEYEKYNINKPIPGHDFKSIWTMYWDLETQPDKLQDGHGVFERDFISLFDARQRMSKYGYIRSAIEKVIYDAQTESIHEKESARPGLREVAHRRKVIDNREYWLRVPISVIEAWENDDLPLLMQGAGEGLGAFRFGDDRETGEEYWILAETMNSEVVRYIPREDNWLPYHMAVWEENLDCEDDPGTGIPWNMREIQHLFTGLIRAFFDNKRLSGDVITAIKEAYIVDPSQAAHVKPGMKINITEDCPNARDAVNQLIIQDVGEGYLSAIGLVDRWKDMASMVPEILQGFVNPKQKADTAYELSQLMENAGKYIGQGVRNIDEYLLENEIFDLYEFNMNDPDVDSGIKGPYKCIPGGFIHYKNRILTVQKIQELLSLILSSEVLVGEAKVRPHLDEIYKNLGFEPDKFLKSEEEKQQEQQARMQMEQQARMQAFQDLAMQTQIETESKIAIEGAKANAKSTEKEDDFQRDVIKTYLPQPREKAERKEK